MLYRIIQEAVNNALRHAEPEEIIIRFTYEEPLLRISIIDDGKGFDVEGALREAKGLGLRSIRERVVLVRGRLDIRSNPEGGTEVLLEVEIPRKADKITEEE